MKKTLKTFIITITIFSVCFITNGVASVLRNEVEHALRTNPKILAEFSNSRSAKYIVDETRGEYFPTVDAVYIRSSDEKVQSNFVLNQPLFTARRISNQVKQSKSNFKFTVFQLREVEDEVALEAVSAYLNVRRRRRLVRLAYNNVEVHKETLRKVMLRFTTGLGRSAEVNLARARLYLAKSRYTTFIGLRQLAISEYIKVIGHPPPKRLPIPKEILNTLPLSKDMSLALALDHNPTIKAAIANIDVAVRELPIIRSRFFPEVSFQFAGKFNRNANNISGTDKDLEVRGVATYNLFKGWSDVSALRSARMLVYNARDKLATVKREVINNVTQSWENWKANSQRVKELNSYAKYSARTLSDYKKQFALGKRALFNVLDQENEVFLSRTEAINSYYDKLIDYQTLLSQIGIINKEIEIEVNSKIRPA